VDAVEGGIGMLLVGRVQLRVTPPLHKADPDRVGAFGSGKGQQCRDGDQTQHPIDHDNFLPPWMAR
jgi:hypothetical protein